MTKQVSQPVGAGQGLAGENFLELEPDHVDGWR
jgi:hypothetical protein